MPPKLQKLQEMMKMVNEGLTREEFVSAFKEVLKIVKDIKDTNSSEWKLIHDAMQKLSNKITSEASTETTTLKKTVLNFSNKEMEKLTKEFNKTLSKVEEKMRAMDEKMDEVKDGQDADEEKIVQEVLAKVPPPPFLTSIEIRDRLEILKDDERLDKSAVKGIDEIEKRITEMAKSAGRGGGTSAIGVRQAFKYIAHTEAPSGAINGVNTKYTVKNNIWWIAGFIINGEQVAELPNFTYAGNTITFASAIPAVYSGKDFEIKYIG